MMSNTNLETIQMKLPKFYKKYQMKGLENKDKSIMFPFLKSFGDAIDGSKELIDRVDAMIGIDTTYDEDLYHRWGSLLGLNKGKGSYGLYRNNIRLSILSGVGGTKEAIKFAVAIIANIENDAELYDKYIQVVDAWEYDGELAPHEDDPVYNIMTNDESCRLNDNMVLNGRYDPHRYGSFVVILDLAANEMVLTPDDGVVLEVVNRVKAAGTNAYIVYIYGINERANITGNEVTIMHITDDKIVEIGDVAIFNEQGGDIDTFSDIIGMIINENGQIDPLNTVVWSGAGTNSDKLLNVDLITNIFMKTDEYSDDIKFWQNDDARISKICDDTVADNITGEILHDRGYITDKSRVFKPVTNDEDATTNDTLETNIYREFDIYEDRMHITDGISVDLVTFDSTNITLWSDLGTNSSSTINGSLITSRFMGADDHIDGVGIGHSDDGSISGECDDSAGIAEITIEASGIESDISDRYDVHTAVAGDIGTIDPINTGRWSSFGLNSFAVIIGTNLITNMVMDTDECYDIIKYT